MNLIVPVWLVPFLGSHCR